MLGARWHYREKLEAIRDNPVALAAVALFALYLRERSTRSGTIRGSEHDVEGRDYC
jgi:hypothetical protein